MKKALFIGISAALIFAALSACGSTAPAPQQEESGPVEPVVQEPTTEPVEDIAPGELSALTSDEILPLFENAYNLYKGDETGAGYAMELMSIEEEAMGLGRQLPADYEDQYKVWRDTQTQDAQDQADHFTEVNETVYATGTVNIRASYSADSAKLGSLSTGSSITRTGIGQGELSGWSKVVMSDGTIAYINSQYLSTTKPSTSSGGSSGGNSGGTSYSPSGAVIVDSGIDGITPAGQREEGPTTSSKEDLATGIEDPYDTIYKPIF